MELVDGLSEEHLNKIGEIMNNGFSQHKRSYQIKQDLFYSLGNKVDGEFFVKLHRAKDDVEYEKQLMHDFYLGYDSFETKDEVYDFFNKSNYLKKHPDLKKEIIDIAIGYIE
jgi:hypothetical protein